MCERLAVKVTEVSGVPYVQVPGEAMWELVESLSCQRTMVHYSHQATGFTVQFLRMDQAAAQAMLDDWSALESASTELSHAGR